MNCMRFIVLAAWCAPVLLLGNPGGANPGSEGEGRPWNTIVAAETSGPVTLALVDLQRYLGQVSGHVPELITPEEWLGSPRPAVVFGTPDSNPLIGELETTAGIVSMEGYRLQHSRIRGIPVVTAVGATPAGIVNSVYGLLDDLGFGFYLGSEGIPAVLADHLSSSTILHNPVFAIRGVLPWYNFFNSPTAWDPVDHRALVDQLVRMRANFVGFHVYDNEPFAAFEDKGRMVMGQRLADSSKPVWSTTPMPTRDFSSGTADVFADEYFGAETTKETDPVQAIRLEQEVMRDALAYGRARGLHTCIGFEIAGYPTRPDERERFLKRFNNLLDQYPDISHVWLWQPEMRGARGTPVPMERNATGDWITSEPLGAYGLSRPELYARASEAKANPRYINVDEEGRLARVIEGARMELYAQLAVRALAKRSNPPRLILSGWGGEDRMLSAEYYEGLDKVLPKDVIFASLDFMVPRARVDSIYSELPADRERWLIPWLEWDGDQWHPQSYIHTYAKMLRNAHASGSQGMLGIHWRTREVEENLAYTVQYAWNPTLTPERFYAGYAQRLYSGDAATSMSTILLALNRLGYRWIGGRGQAEYNHFTWGPGMDERKVERLQRLLSETRTLLPLSGTARARFEWLIHRMEYVLAFQAMGRAAVTAGDLLADAAVLPDHDATRSRELAKKARATLDPQLLHRALQSYALRLSTRGEYGVLATINTKAVPAWRELTRSASNMAGDSYTTPTTIWRPEPGILVPRFHSSWTAGSPLELYPVVLGGQPAWTRYRTIGETEWTVEHLPLMQRFVHYANIPAAAMKPPGVEIAFSLSENPDDASDFGPIAVTVMPPMMLPVAGKERSRSGNIPEIKLSSESVDGPFARLEWTDVPQADFFRVLRNGEILVDTPLTFFPDLPHPGAAYTVEAWPQGQKLGESSIHPEL